MLILLQLYEKEKKNNLAKSKETSYYKLHSGTCNQGNQLSIGSLMDYVAIV